MNLQRRLLNCTLPRLLKIALMIEHQKSNLSRFFHLDPQVDLTFEKEKARRLNKEDTGLLKGY